VVAPAKGLLELLGRLGGGDLSAGLKLADVYVGD
jgi:hypothetical protein